MADVWWLAFLLGCVATGPTTSEPTPLEQARADLHAAERKMLLDQAEAHLASGKFEEAGLAVLALERVGGAPELADRVAAAAEAADPGLAGQLHTSLAAAIRDDAKRAANHAEAARRLHVAAIVRSRYAGPDAQTVAAGRRGVGPELIGPVLELAVAHHVSPPDPARIAAAGADRLEAVAAIATGVDRAAFSEALAAARAAPPTELAAATESGRALVVAAVTAGLPVEAATAEWVEGALSTFDAWTRVTWPAELAGWEAHHAGVELGVGLELEEGGVHVSLPVPGGPAWRAGVHQGDRVVAVEDAAGRTLAEAGPDAILAALAGEPGSAVKLEVDRRGEALGWSLAREPVPERVLFGWTVDEANHEVLAVPGHPGVGYLRIAAFRPTTDEAVTELLEGAELTSLILDLRGNSGGDAQAACNVIDRFVGEGIAARLEGPGAPPPPPEGSVAWNALLPGDAWEALPVAVLVDRDTASAAELAAGALAERDGIVLIGERTFGKGWSQGLVNDPKGGFALTVTNAAWTLGNGRSIHREEGAATWGVDPDVVLVASAAEAWQNRARRSALEFPRAHADGTPMQAPVTVGREGLPLLPEDPAVARALSVLEGS